jgi:sugar/nucleoside kinase (ribokinase family)
MDGNLSEPFAHSDGRALRKLLGSCDIFLPNEREALLITGAGNVDEALSIMSACCPRVVIKLGERGLLASWDGTRYAMPSLNVVARDTTGAGDSFDAALLAAVLDGRSAKEALARGAAAGALAASAPDEERRAVTAEAIERASAEILARSEIN